MNKPHKDRHLLDDLLPRLLADDAVNPVEPKYPTEEAESLSVRLELIAEGYSSNGSQIYADSAMSDLHDVARSLSVDAPEDELNRLLRTVSHFSWVQQHGNLTKSDSDDELYIDQAIYALIRAVILQHQRIDELERQQPSKTWELVQRVITWIGLLELGGKFLGWWATTARVMRSQTKRVLNQSG